MNVATLVFAVLGVLANVLWLGFVGGGFVNGGNDYMGSASLTCSGNPTYSTSVFLGVSLYQNWYCNFNNYVQKYVDNQWWYCYTSNPTATASLNFSSGNGFFGYEIFNIFAGVGAIFSAFVAIASVRL
jgi:hypothetical protein